MSEYIILNFYSAVDTDFSGKKMEVVFENGDSYIYQFNTQSEINDDSVNNSFTNYKLIKVEDGIWNLIYANNGMMTTSVLNLSLHTVEKVETKLIDFKSNNMGFISSKGSFQIINELNGTNKSLLTNEQKALDFWIRYFDKHDETAIDDYLTDPYIQHNPNVADGVEAFRNEFHDRFTEDMKECRTVVKRVSSRNDLVFIHNILKRSPNVKGHAAVDIFRFENGKIVEHWDVIQKMPDESKNDHPMF